MINAPELRVRRMLAMVGKQLRKMARSGTPTRRTELSLIADAIREELAKPRERDALIEEPDESPQPREKTP